MALAQTSVQNDVSMAVLSKAMDANETMGDGIAKMIDAAAMTISCYSTEEMYEMLAEDIKNREDAETIAVLCLDAADAKKTAEQLQAKLPEDIPVTLLTKDSMKFGRGIFVMPFYLAKGLEFDAVFIPETEKYVTSLHKQALYIDATRALHFLRLYEVQI